MVSNIGEELQNLVECEDVYTVSCASVLERLMLKISYSKVKLKFWHSFPIIVEWGRFTLRRDDT